MNEPCVSSAAFDLLICGIVVGLLGFCAIAYACSLLSEAAIGKKLASAFDGDRVKAWRCAELIAADEAESAKARDAGLDAVYRRGLSGCVITPDFRARVKR